MTGMNEATFRRFAAKVAPPHPETGCMEWTATKTQNGYGMFHLGTRMHLAHRIAYTYWVGPVPNGLVVDHLCRNRACVNPDHLEVKTNRENATAPGSLTGRHLAERTHCPRGHELAGANLKPATARQGWRGCLACNRAQTTKANSRRMHDVEWTEDLLAMEADIQFHAIATA